MDAPQATIPIRDFTGLQTDTDPHDIQPGVALEQINCTSEKTGVLQSRLGLKLLQAEATATLYTF